jgi:hypothetical protein
MAVAGNSSRVASLAGLTLPIESHVLQAIVSEAVKPAIDVCPWPSINFRLNRSYKPPRSS